MSCTLPPPPSLSTSKKFVVDNLPSLAALAAPLVFVVQAREMSKWRQVLVDNAANFSQDEGRQRIGNIELIHKMGRVVRLAMGTREVVGLIVFCSLFLFKSIATWNRVACNGQVLEAFAFGTGRRKAVLRFGLASLAMAAVESTITHVRFWLIASIRETLSKSLHKLLMERERFARAKYEAECDAATSIPHYCGEFAEHCAELPYYFLSPTFDAGVALLYFWKSIGGQATRILTATTFGSLFLIRRFQPDLARLHARVVTMEGAFQKRHFSVQERSEAISMASGSAYFYDALNTSLRNVYAATCRYAAGTANFFLMFRIVELAVWEVIPLLLWLANDDLQGEGAVRTLVMQRDAVRRFTRSIAILFKNIREISHLKEFTEKLNVFINSLSEVDVVSNGHDPARQPPRIDFAQPSTLVEFHDVTLRTPTNAELMFYNFSHRIKEGTSWLIVGRNGCGKTSLQRALRGLWPVAGGRIRVASDVQMLTLPQQSFHLPEATLREQLWFPQRPTPLSNLSASEIDEENKMARLSLALACIEQVEDLIGGWENSGFVRSKHEGDDDEGNNDAIDSETGSSPATIPTNYNRSNPSSSSSSSVVEYVPDAASQAYPLQSFSPLPNSPMSQQPMPSATNGQADGSTDFAWSSLSGGQSQKLALARVFFTIQIANRDSINKSRCPVPRFLLLLDESTSQVDSDAEDKILRHIRSLPNVTLMCISHRKHSVAYADHVLLIGETKTPQVFTKEEFLGRGEWLLSTTISPSPAVTPVTAELVRKY